MTDLSRTKLDMSKAKSFGDGLYLIQAAGWAFVAVPTDAKTVAEAGPSSTGKTRSIGTTRGFLSVPGTEVKISLNATAPLAGQVQPGVQG